MKNTNYILLTGVTGAIGKATVTELVKIGSHPLLLVGRTESSLLQLRQEVQPINPLVSIHLLTIDLANIDAVKAGIAKIIQEYKALHAIINLAAVITKERTLVKGGLETMFATNYLGPFLLTAELSKAFSPAYPLRIITVTSASTSRIDFANLQGEKRFSSIANFSQSKTCNVLLVKKLARELVQTPSVSFGFDPGIVRSKAMDEMPKLFGLIGKLVGKPPQQAAYALTQLATDPGFEHANGQFFNQRLQPIKVSSYAEDQQIQDKLWKESWRKVENITVLNTTQADYRAANPQS